MPDLDVLDRFVVGGVGITIRGDDLPSLGLVRKLLVQVPRSPRDASAVGDVIYDLFTTTDPHRLVKNGRPLFSIPVALSIMVFFALCCQCGATLAIIRRESGSWRWPLFTFAYMTIIAYVASFAVYQGGMLLGWGGA